VALVVADAELLLDHLGNAGAGPDLAAEAIRLGAVPQEVGDEALLGRGELGRVSGGRAGAERLGAAGAGAAHPAADRLLGDPEGLSDGPLRPAVLLQVQGPPPPPFAPILGEEVSGAHPLF
jgi:hypothetical protein